MKQSANDYPLDNYSTDEQVVGTYLGKPLYQRTVAVGAMTSDDTFYYFTDLGITNIEHAFLVNCYITHDGGFEYTTPFFRGTGDYFFPSIFSNCFRVITTSTIYPHITGGYFTMRYTKTTD